MSAEETGVAIVGSAVRVAPSRTLVTGFEVGTVPPRRKLDRLGDEERQSEALDPVARHVERFEAVAVAMVRRADRGGGDRS